MKRADRWSILILRSLSNDRGGFSLRLEAASNISSSGPAGGKVFRIYDRRAAALKGRPTTRNGTACRRCSSTYSDVRQIFNLPLAVLRARALPIRALRRCSTTPISPARPIAALGEHVQDRALHRHPAKGARTEVPAVQASMILIGRAIKLPREPAPHDSRRQNNGRTQGE